MESHWSSSFRRMHPYGTRSRIPVCPDSSLLLILYTAVQEKYKGASRIGPSPWMLTLPFWFWSLSNMGGSAGTRCWGSLTAKSSKGSISSNSTCSIEQNICLLSSSFKQQAQLGQKKQVHWRLTKCILHYEGIDKKDSLKCHRKLHHNNWSMPWLTLPISQRSHFYIVCNDHRYAANK